MQVRETITDQTTTGANTLFDADGFLLDFELWSEDLGREIAAQHGVAPLTEKHLRVIRYIRDRFQELDAQPSMRRVCRATDIPKAQVYALFGGCLAIWRIAGLPNPGEEAKAYLI